MVVPMRSRVQIPVGTNFCPWVKSRSGIFPRPGEAVLFPLNKKQWSPFTPPAAFEHVDIVSRQNCM